MLVCFTQFEYIWSPGSIFKEGKLNPKRGKKKYIPPPTTY